MGTAVLALGLGLAAAPAPAAKPGFLVTWSQGRVEVSGDRGQTWRPLARGDRVDPRGQVRTGEAARVELVGGDGSRVRVGASGHLEIDRAASAPGRRTIGLRLWAGRLWARVTKAQGPRSSFEVRTAHAIAGVRGTAFAVVARADLSAVVRVYTGSVGVRGADSGGNARHSRKRVAGPQRVTRAQWEEVVATAMTEVRISAAGEIRPAESFEDEGGSLLWAEWNQARDAKP